MARVVEELDRVLGDLKQLNDIKALAIVSRDGLLITANMAPDVHGEMFAAMAATMLSAAETASLELNQGAADRLIVETDDSRLVIMGAGERMMLVLLAGPRADPLAIMIEMNEAVARIKKALGNYQIGKE